VSNPDSPGPYGPEPAGVGRPGSRRGHGREDRYDREDYGRPANGNYGRPTGNDANGYGRSNGNPAAAGRPYVSGGPAGAGRPNSNGGPAGAGRPNGNGRPAGNGAGGYGPPPNGRAGNGGPGNGGPANGRTANGGGRGPGNGGAAERYGRQDAGYGRPDGYGPPDGYGRDGGRRSSRGNGSDPGTQDPRGPQYGRRRAGGGTRGRGSQVGSDLRSRLGLSNGQGPQPGAGPADDGYSGTNGYGGAGAGGYGAGATSGSARGYAGRPGYGPGGPPGGPSGYDDDYGTRGGRGATALRERGTSRFTSVRSRGTRRAGEYGYGDGTGSGDGFDGGGPRQRRKGDWWRHWTWRKAVAVAVAAGVGMVLLVMATVVYFYEKTQIPTAVSEAALQQSSTVYFSDGKTSVGTFSANGIDRQMLSSGQIPDVMKNAIIAAEDRNFYHEGGIAPSGILRSAYVDVKGGDGLQGGSTLTEEFVKNYYTTIGASRAVSSKIKEIFIAIKLSHEKSKDWIMTQYLNTVPFGSNAYGVAAASQTYFGEPAAKLTVPQSAMLAAMVQLPSFYSPDPSAGAGYQALVSRWHYVLTNMVRDGALTQAQADAQVFPKVQSENELAAGWSGYKGYIMAQVEAELESTYGYTQQQIDSRGLKIVTTINAKMNSALQKAVKANIAQMKDDGGALPWYAHVGAILEQPGTGAILAEYGGPNFDASDCTKIRCQWNMATQNREQVGSSFKPYVLSDAVYQGMDVQNSVLNGIEPMCVPSDETMADQLALSQPTTNCPAPGFEVNIAGENTGPLSVQKAAAISSDPAFEDLIHRVGTVNTVNLAQKFGVNIVASGLKGDEHEVGLALGIGSLTVEEQATTFATLDNGGVYVTPHIVAQITDSKGNNVPLKIVHRQVLTQQQAADVAFALSADVEPGGTAFPNAVLNPERPTIAKTGTTDNAQSAFFIGAIPQYALAVGMFTNEQGAPTGQATAQSLNGLPSVNGQGGGFGGTWPATIWKTYMQDEFSNLPVLSLAAPNYVNMTKWVQVPKQAKKKQPQKQNPNPNPSCPTGHRRFGPCPDPSASANPSPSPSPSPSTSPSIPPFGGGGGGGGNNTTLHTTSAVLLPAAGEPSPLLPAAEEPLWLVQPPDPDTG
jgi:membrane peptidoglycan carboxypeptidase